MTTRYALLTIALALLLGVICGLYWGEYLTERDHAAVCGR